MLNGFPSRSIVSVVSVASIMEPLTSFPFFCLTSTFASVLICWTTLQSFDDACWDKASGAWLESKSNTSSTGRVLRFMMFSFSRRTEQALFLLVLVKDYGATDCGDAGNLGQVVICTKSHPRQWADYSSPF